MQKTVLILGSNGRFGRHCCDAFWNAGWTIRLFDRKTDTLATAATGCDVIVAGWNPPYTQWADQIPRLHARIQNAAKAVGACVVLPGNVYVFGANTTSPWSEKTPHQATNPLGRIRIDLEESYRNSGVQTIVLRAGDFIDTAASEGWLDKVILPTLTRGQLIYPGDPDISHAWAYLPDLAKAAEMLAAQKYELDTFEDITFPGYTLSGTQMADMLSDASGRPLAVRRMSWLPLKLVGPLWPMAKHLLEMRYLWDVPHRLQSDRFETLCPEFRETPVHSALTSAAAQWLSPVQPRRTWCQSICNSTQTSL